MVLFDDTGKTFFAVDMAKNQIKKKTVNGSVKLTHNRLKQDLRTIRNIKGI